MIIESIVAGLTVIVVSSLAFANAQIKRQRKWDMEDNFEDEQSSIKPFLKVVIGANCPVCGRTAEKNNGLRQPKTCVEKDKCEEVRPHLHVECTWCNCKWLMKPADAKNNDY